jgi:alpha-tubulin suppressor-like RCC1 family protein
MRIQGTGEVVAVAADNGHALALSPEGGVWAWGQNARGQLGEGTLDRRLAPTRVRGLSGGVAVAAGGAFSLALRDDGSVWSWGDNAFGQLGNAPPVYAPFVVRSLLE